MRAFISTVLNLVSRIRPSFIGSTPFVPPTAEAKASLNLISKKTEALLLSKNTKTKLKEERHKSVQKSWAASIIVEEADADGVRSSRGNYSDTLRLDLDKQPQYLKRVTTTAGTARPEEGNLFNSSTGGNKEEKKRRRVYRRKLGDSTWTTEPMDEKLIWVDCEMTGLKVDSDIIMEIGCIITDPDLKELARTSSVILHVPEEKLAGLDAWCLKHHGESGLIEACRESKVNSLDVDDQLLNFVQKYTRQGECPMAGNSIYMDRMFISKQFPKFHSHFHYRNVDVSTLKELVRRWHPEQYSEAPKKKFAHRVVDDIEDSIAELGYYRSAVFRQTSPVKNSLTEKN